MGVGGEHPHGGQDAGGDVGDRCAALHRRLARPGAGDAHQAGHALGHEIEARAVGVGAAAAEARQRAVDQLRELGPQGVVAEAEALHRTGTVILDEHVGVAQQAPQHVAALRILEIEGEAALAPVHHQVGGTLTLDRRWNRAPRVVAAVDLLDLDHRGTHVGEHQPADRAGHDVGEFDDLEAGEGTVASGLGLGIHGIFRWHRRPGFEAQLRHRQACGPTHPTPVGPCGEGECGLARGRRSRTDIQSRAVPRGLPAPSGGKTLRFRQPSGPPRRRRRCRPGPPCRAGSAARRSAGRAWPPGVRPEPRTPPRP